MRNRIFILIFIFIFQPLMAENLKIESKSISIDKKSKLTIFKENVIATDNKNNSFKSNYAEYDKNLKILKSVGETSIETSEGFLVSGKDFTFDNLNNFIKSESIVVIEDLEKNI